MIEFKSTCFASGNATNVANATVTLLMCAIITLFVCQSLWAVTYSRQRVKSSKL